MKKERVLVWAVCAAIALGLVGLLVGCGGMGAVAGATKGKTGSIYVNLGFKQAQDIVGPPPGSLTVTNYHITGQGPSGATFAVDSATSTTISGLLQGHWIVTVQGQNASSVVIGQGSAEGDLLVGQTLQLAITVNELAGNGSLHLALQWEPAIVGAPVWTGTMQGYTGAPVPMTFVTNVPNCTSVTDVPGLPAGFYSTIVELFDAPNGMDGSQVLSTGAAFITRIMKDVQTTGSIFVHAVAGHGLVNVTITNNIGQEIPLVGSPVFGNLNIYNRENMPVTVSTSDGTVGALTSAWYLNGQQVAVGVNTYTIHPEDFRNGEHYRLDVLSWNNNGTRAGSNTYVLFKYDVDLTTTDLSGIITTGVNASGEMWATFWKKDSNDNLTKAFSDQDLGPAGPYAVRNYDLGQPAPAGGYYVKAYLLPPGTSFGDSGTYTAWYYFGQNNPPNGNSGAIPVPHTAGQTFDIPQLYLQP